MKTSLHRIDTRAQRGLTLIEFMISIVIGMLMVAAIATLIANQSTNRGEVDRAGKMIENGRYAMQAMAFDAQLAGYWGEYYQAPGTGTVTMDPCTTTVADVKNDTLEHVQGFEETAGAFPSCISNRRAGTDVFVVRRVDTDSSDVETGGVVDWAKLKPGQIYLQSGLDTTSQLKYVIAAATGVALTDQTAFYLKKKDKTTSATLRKMVVHIYYISECSVEIAGSCTNADGGTPIPTLKRAELTYDSTTNAPKFTITTLAEGIENLQVDYGIDKDADGSPDAYLGASSWDTDAKCQLVLGSATATPQAACWGDVMTARIYLLARAGEATPGYTDTKKYVMGSYGAASAASSESGYRRHVFTQTVKLVNPSGRAAP
jgi:type IV pilus assembly protein PilW